ncbi:sugar O-acetyltransferase [Ligilactobacillus salitolerans]|uniref:Acetyltransferase n=1 Tax=Ligilactobacillus salitolerans TaxID=1808352 RepID=A0A401IS89_9LACO|nr:sugar O-acetyltransferase [Ligilactobacillus salitolerans]GBG94391.1 sugar O-acetyltransferase [Ligilactobacillus salitolerans]
MTNDEKRIAGKLYDPEDPVCRRKAKRAHLLCQKYNETTDGETQTRQELLDQLLGSHGENVFCQGPLYVDYGSETMVGDNFYANFNLTILDTCPVRIGNNEFLGPNITLATPLHGLLPRDRNPHLIGDKIGTLEYGKPITIGDNCWLGAGVIVNPGVTIGAGSVIGSGSVVTRDIPAGVLAVGNPCRVVRKLTEADQLQKQDELW